MGEIMIKFKKTFYKIEKTGSKLSIRFSNYKVDDGYISDAFRGIDGDSENMYIGAYPASLENNKLKTESGKVPVLESLDDARRQLNVGYNVLSYDRYLYLYGLMLLITKSTDINKYLGSSSNTDKAGSLNNKGLFFRGATSNKVFGIENLWSGNYTLLDGIYEKNNDIYYKPLGGYDAYDLYDKLNTDGKLLSTGYISDIGTNKFMYPTRLDGSSTSNLVAYSDFKTTMDDVIHNVSVGGPVLGESYPYNISNKHNVGLIRLSY